MSDLALKFSRAKVVVLGDVILDSYIMGEVSRLSPEAPVPIVAVNKRSSSLGGSGNVSLNLRGLGCDVSLFAVRGPDASGERIAAILQEKGIRDRLLVDPQHITTTKTRIIGHKQQLARLDEEIKWKDTEHYREDLMKSLRKELDDAQAVILSDYNKGVLNGALTQAAIRECRDRGLPVFVDPKRKNWERYAGATCITPNTSELEQIYGRAVENEDELLTAVRALKKEYQLEWFLATRGAEGMCLMAPDDSPLFISATATEVFDVSGAGDTVISTLAAAVASGIPFREAATLSNLAAGVVVRKLGAQPITIGELETEWRATNRGATLKASAASKISPTEAAQLQVKAWQAAGQRVTLAFGSFEVIHPGHTHFLSQARKAGNRLVVVLTPSKASNRDGFTAQERANVLAALGAVDLVVLCGGDEKPAGVATSLGPDIVALDQECLDEYAALRKLVEQGGGTVEVIPPLPGYTAAEMAGKFSR